VKRLGDRTDRDRLELAVPAGYLPWSRIVDKWEGM